MLADRKINCFLVEFFKHDSHNYGVFVRQHLAKLLLEASEGVTVPLNKNQIKALAHEVVSERFAGFVASSVDDCVRFGATVLGQVQALLA